MLSAVLVTHLHGDHLTDLNDVPPMAPGQARDWRALALQHFAGEIVLGDDLTTVEL